MISTDWMEAAQCRDSDTEQFFQDEGVEAIRTYCDKCPVRSECLNWALDMEKGYPKLIRFGVFGGMTARERARLDYVPVAGSQNLRRGSTPRQQALRGKRNNSGGKRQTEALERVSYLRGVSAKAKGLAGWFGL